MKDVLGKTMKDQITGFQGVVTGRCEYLTGCHQLLLSPKMEKGGKPECAEWFDEQRCLPVRAKRIVLDNSKTPGFDKPAPQGRRR
jgi:hypothetical protein